MHRVHTARPHPRTQPRPRARPVTGHVNLDNVTCHVNVSRVTFHADLGDVSPRLQEEPLLAHIGHGVSELHGATVPGHLQPGLASRLQDIVKNIPTNF